MSAALTGGEGKLYIQVCVDQGVIVRVAPHSTRPIQACALLIGRPLEEAMALLPRWFSLCATAQSVAGLTAAENALGLRLPPAQSAARQLLVAAEALEQTLWRLLLDWPRSVGLPPAVESFKRLRQALKSLPLQLFSDPAWQRISGGPLLADVAALARTLTAIETELEYSVYGLAYADQDRREGQGFRQWVAAAPTVVAATLHLILEHGLADFGRSAVEPLPALNPQWLAQRLADAADDAFCAYPQRDGVVYETGALARQWTHPLLAALCADYGTGLLTRLAARLIECGALVTEIRQRAQTVIHDAAADVAPAAAATANGSGLGVVECARGRLAHWLKTENGTVSAYRILAPTEWNFHPEGPLSRGLVGRRVGEGVRTRQAVEWLVTALDPCVDFVLDLREARMAVD